MYELTLPPNFLDDINELMEQTVATELVSMQVRECQGEVRDIVSAIVDVSQFHYSNIFSHIEPISVHADISDKKRSILLIPIDAHPDQHFVVFDQIADSPSPVSWIGNQFDHLSEDELKARYYHTSRRVRPCDDDCVVGLTGKPVSDELAQHLPYHPDFYHGLSGKAWPYQVGKALLFSANNIHATGKMKSPKTGLTVQFREPDLDQVVLATTTRSRF